MPFKVQVGSPQIAIHHDRTILISEEDGQVGWPSDNCVDISIPTTAAIRRAPMKGRIPILFMIDLDFGCRGLQCGFLAPSPSPLYY